MTYDTKRSPGLRRRTEQWQRCTLKLYASFALFWVTLLIAFLSVGQLPPLRSTTGTESGSITQWSLPRLDVLLPGKDSGKLSSRTSDTSFEDQSWELVEESLNVSKVNTKEAKNGIWKNFNHQNAAEEEASQYQNAAEEDEGGGQGQTLLNAEQFSGQDAINLPQDAIQARSFFARAGDRWGAHDLGQNGSKTCASVEEMGAAAAGDAVEASLRLRKSIQTYLVENGASRVRDLPPDQFCKRSFVLGKAQHDGFGNNIYKLLTAAGLGVILNRSLIIGESSCTNPSYIGTGNRPLRRAFGDYLTFSDEAFTMREVKALWADNDCSQKYNRPLKLQVDDFGHLARSSVLCKDWTKLDDPIFMFRDTQDAIALQFLLRNQHESVRSAAATVLGDPSQPNSRPNTFGELMRVFIQPSPKVRAAVDWTLRRSAGATTGQSSLSEPPDMALHLRMRNSSSRTGPEAACTCIGKILSKLNLVSEGKKKVRIVVVSDTPSLLTYMKRSNLLGSAEIFGFNYQEYVTSFNPLELSLREDVHLPPSKRKLDWGPLPRWVAVVDFFLAASAKYAVVSGAHRRVATTYAQLLGSLAAANTLVEKNLEEPSTPARFFSSFQSSLLLEGLVSQLGWGHSWRPFNGKLSCSNQPAQCAVTPLLPYAWWDAPWQSPSVRDQLKMESWGITIGMDGTVSDESVEHFCRQRKRAGQSILLALPKAKPKLIKRVTDGRED